MPWSSRTHPFHEIESIYCFYWRILMWKMHFHSSSLWNIILKHFNIKTLTLTYFWHNLNKKLHWYVTPMYIYPYAKNNFATKTFLELLEFQGSSNLISQDKVRGIPELTITKQKHLINSLVPRMSSPSIMSRYMFNIACYLSIEVWKVLKSDWFRKLLATCKTSEKSNIFPMQLFTARQESKEITKQTEKGHFTEPHHTIHMSNKINTCWLLLKRLFWPKSWNQYLPSDFLEKFLNILMCILILAMTMNSHTDWLMHRQTDGHKKEKKPKKPTLL